MLRCMLYWLSWGFFLCHLKKHYKNGSIFSGHVSQGVPGVELSTGSLGHGLVFLVE